MLYFIARGARLGLYPSLTFCCTEALAIIVALNYGPDLASSVASAWPQSRAATQIMTAHLVLFALGTIVFSYPALRYFSATAPMLRGFDQAAGAVFGGILGLMVVGMLSLAWFESPFYHHPKIKFDVSLWKDNRPDQLMARYLAVFFNKTAGAEVFKPELLAKAEDVAPMPFWGGGFWIGSVPHDARVYFTYANRDSSSRFRQSIMDLMDRSDKELLTSTQDSLELRFVGRAPQLFNVEAAQGREARSLLVAVEVVLPDELTKGLGENQSPFIRDGEITFFTHKAGNETRLVRIYSLQREEDFAPLIALFQPIGATDAELDALFTGEPVYEVKNSEWFEAQLNKYGATADHGVLKSRYQAKGKVVFQSATGWVAIQASREGPKFTQLGT